MDQREGMTSFRHGALNFVGLSRSGYRTVLDAPELDLVFDLGLCDLAIAGRSSALVTHLHQDHALGILRMLSLRDMTGQAPPKIYVPASGRDQLHEIIQRFDRIEGRSNRAGDGCDVIRGVVPGDRLQLRRDLVVETLPVEHSLDSVGYRVQRLSRRLLAELRGLEGTEIAALRRTGVRVEEEKLTDLVTYIGDMSVDTLDALDDAVLASPVLVLEATYLLPEDRERAAERGHTHIEELAERADRLQCELLILKHFSLKYEPETIRQEIARALPAELHERTKLMLPA